MHSRRNGQTVRFSESNAFLGTHPRHPTERCVATCSSHLSISCGAASVSLSEVDRLLLQRCLDQAPRAWQDFVDRFVGLVIHVANHTAEARGISIDRSTRDDLVADVFLTLVANDFGVLRRFRRNCSLATYLTVIARRVISRRLLHPVGSSNGVHLGDDSIDAGADANAGIQRIEDHEEVQNLLLRLDPKEANVVRMYHLEGKSYEEISRSVGMSPHSIGPVLSRAREKMRGR